MCCFILYYQFSWLLSFFSALASFIYFIFIEYSYGLLCYKTWWFCLCCKTFINFLIIEVAIDILMLLQSNDKSNGSNFGGPTQRASALAALSSAFGSSPGAKVSAQKPSSSGQGSQRAAAVAALSSVLTAEKKKSPDASPTQSSGNTPAETSPPCKKVNKFLLDIFTCSWNCVISDTF